MPPLGSIYLIFMQFSANIVPDNRLLPPLLGMAAPSGKAWIRHCNFKTLKLKYLLLLFCVPLCTVYVQTGKGYSEMPVVDTSDEAISLEYCSSGH